jgi:hypothetical protein
VRDVSIKRDKKVNDHKPVSNARTRYAKKFTDANPKSLSNIHVRGSQLTGSFD